jgi:hypothetical protein
MTNQHSINLALSIRTSARSIFENLVGQTKFYAPFIITKFWSDVKQSRALEVAHFNAVNNDCEDSYKQLADKLTEVLNSQLPADIAEVILYNNKIYQTHCEVAQASMLEPHEEEEVWAVWDEWDGQAAYDERFEMYYNEY